MTGDGEHGVQSGGVAGARSANFTVKAEAPRRMECLMAIFLGMRPAAQKRTWVLTQASPHRVPAPRSTRRGVACTSPQRVVDAGRSLARRTNAPASSSCRDRIIFASMQDSIVFGRGGTGGFMKTR